MTWVPGLRKPGIGTLYPHVRCDECPKTLCAITVRGGLASWARKDQAPPDWRRWTLKDGTRRDRCPQCRERARLATEAKQPTLGLL